MVRCNVRQIIIGQVEHLTVGTSLWMDPRMEGGGVSKWTPDGRFFGHLTRIIRQLAARRARKNWDFGLKIVDLMSGNTSYGAQNPKKSCPAGGNFIVWDL